MFKKYYTALETIFAYMFILMTARAAEAYQIKSLELIIILPLVMIATYILLMQATKIFKTLYKGLINK